MMNRVLTFAVFFLLCIHTLWSQGTLTSANPNPVSPGYAGTMTITGSGTQFHKATAGINLKLTHIGSGQIYNFGNAPFGVGWEPGSNVSNPTVASGTVNIPSNAQLGNYNVELTGYSGDNYLQNMYVSASGLLQVSGAGGTFNGKVIVDADSSCSQTPGDHGAQNALVTATPGGFYAIVDANGNFSMSLPVGTYTFSCQAPSGTTTICPVSPFTQTATVTTPGGTTSGIDFYCKPDFHADLAAWTYITLHSPGLPNNYAHGTASNMGGDTARQVTISLIKPSLFAPSGAYMPGPPSAINGDTLVWNLGDLAPGASFSCSARFSVPIGTPLGTVYSYQTIASTASVEPNLTNNSDTKSDVVVGSFDPNDKRVWNSAGQNADGFILPTDTLLRYVIRFQNTGTAPAYNIVVRDTLDLDFDLSTLRIAGSSHPMSVQFDDSTGSRVRFVFDNIMLVDSLHNEPDSHGWLEYSLRRKNGLPNGTVLHNEASIYFDFNAPVRTNDVNSKICPQLGTAYTFTVSALNVTFHAPTTGGATGYAWTYGDGQTGPGANPTHVYAAGGTYNVCVTITNACGRSQQICQTVVVNCAPMNAGFSSGVVSGLTMHFTNASTGPINSYYWTFGDGTTGTTTSPSHTYLQPGSYTVCLVTGNTCAEHDTACATIAVGCTTAPSAGFSSNLTGNNASFANTSTGTNLSYVWDFGDGTTSTLASPSHTYLAVGSFQACLTVTDVCLGTSSHCATVVVSCLSPATGFATVTNLLNVSFTDQSTNSPTSWTWDFGDGNTATVASPNHTYAIGGTYHVCLTTSNGCGSNDFCQDVTVTATGQPVPQFGNVSLVPIPAADHIVLRMENAQIDDVKFQVCDMLGRVIKAWSVAEIVGDYYKELDVTTFADGMYFLRLDQSGYSQSYRFAVRH